ncbi:hypothetical protein GCM10011494_34360 [Novosphingobium endophyticum]|uniref:Uncharacterized protein n=1 Tax=Novosphingobium endophyticum TaxID=1955250 RepID=A0A916TUX3_9SPHN|nr:hypothetical protein [Novosphingobium endophyticum]GGC12651.1 hypothetical protein GCM10011494_34360 [Novosphingobium endophyticum]
MNTATGQLGFDTLLQAAETDNRVRRIERETAHLPGTMAEALPYYRLLLRQHHAAMLAANVDETMRLREEARRLALKLNGGEPGILAGPEAPGCVLERESAAKPGSVPRWGQTGAFIIELGSMQVAIDLNGIFGIGSSVGFWPGFAAHAVELDKPFLSSTGYRSFLGIHADPQAELSPDEFAAKVVGGYVARELGGKLVTIDQRYRERAA